MPAPEGSDGLAASCAWLLQLLTCGLCGGRLKEEGALREPLLGSGSGGAPSAHSSPETTRRARDRSGPPPKGAHDVGPPDVSNILHHSARDVLVDFELGRVLGQGAYGLVRLAVHRATRQRYACKTVKKAQLRRRADVDDIRREVVLLQMLSSHPNVAGLVAAYEDAGAVHLVLELCEGGELLARVAGAEALTEREAARYFGAMAEVVRHCHALGIIHRDVKPENFLLSTPGPDAVVKAADFGLSQFFRPGKPFRSLVGSAYYVAPEVLNRCYGPPADVWSLGVCLYILLSGLTPFWGDTEDEIFDMVLNAEIDLETHPWPSVSPAARDLVMSCLQRDPARRPSPAAVLQHPWLRAAQPDRPLDSVVIARVRTFAAMSRVKRAAMLLAAQDLVQEGEAQGQVGAPAVAATANGIAEAASGPGATAGPPAGSADADAGGGEPPPLPEELRMRAAALFASLDTDGSGRLSVAELREGLSRLGASSLSREQAQALTEAMDLDQDGEVDYVEWVAATLGKSLAGREDVLRSLFARFDADHSGSITQEELHRPLAPYGVSEEDARRAIYWADSNQDDELQYAEFQRLMASGTDTLKPGAPAPGSHASLDELESQQLGEGAALEALLRASVQRGVQEEEEAPAGPTAAQAGGEPPAAAAAESPAAQCTAGSAAQDAGGGAGAAAPTTVGNGAPAQGTGAEPKPKRRGHGGGRRSRGKAGNKEGAG